MEWSHKIYEHTIKLSMADLETILQEMGVKDAASLICEVLDQNDELRDKVRGWLLDE